MCIYLLAGWIQIKIRKILTELTVGQMLSNVNGFFQSERPRKTERKAMYGMYVEYVVVDRYAFTRAHNNIWATNFSHLGI